MPAPLPPISYMGITVIRWWAVPAVACLLTIGVGNGVFWGAHFCPNRFRGGSRNFGRGWVKSKLLKINFRVVSEAQWAKAERPEVWGHLLPPEANRLYIWPQMHSELSSFDILQ